MTWDDHRTMPSSSSKSLHGIFIHLKITENHRKLPALVQYIYQWIGLRENLQETIDFPIKYGAFL